MHLNKLSTAALMRLSVLAALNLIMGRMLGGWILLMHPLFFLTVLTLDLGLYALMVYSGTLNRTLIAMMLAGLAEVVAIILYNGIGPGAFAYGGRFRDLGFFLHEKANELLATPPPGMNPGRPWRLTGDQLTLMAYVPVDVLGLAAIVLAGLVARAWQTRSGRREPPGPPLDSASTTPL
jgi:hypothetical protein